MSRKVRVFVSSTMEDLANERQSVVDHIKALELTPVNAEKLLPNGESSWDLLAGEIETSHIFVLILGERYGWVPSNGGNKSVTHLETDLARKLGIPILPFLKRLKYGSDASSEDAVRRDAFRKEIGGWGDGFFRAEFNLAMDLGDSVRKALLYVFQNTYLKRAVREVNAAQTSRSPSITPQLTSIRRNPLKAPDVLFAGAGFSVSAGYPTASSLVEVLGQRLGLTATGPEMLARHSFNEIFAYAEDRLQREGLVEIIQELLDTPIPVEPTSAHLLAVQTFSVILTTNYDVLFERACKSLGIKYRVTLPQDSQPSSQETVTIHKISGSIDRPETLSLTNADAAKIEEQTMFWDSIRDLLQSHGVTVIGHSLRDLTSQRLLADRNLTLPGVYVSPVLDEIDTILLHRFRLKGIKANANEHLSKINTR